jgi:ParB-like chromosome segregation protein Spo0J
MTTLLPLLALAEDPEQPRTVFDPTDIEALATTIWRQGLLTPVVVSRDDDGEQYMVFDGARRFRAFQLNRARIASLPLDDLASDHPALRYDRWTMIPVSVQEMPSDPIQRLIDQVTVNESRKSLTLLEVASAHLRALEKSGLSKKEFAAAHGVAPQRLSDYEFVLHKTDALTRDALEAGQLLSPDAVRLFSRLPDLRRRALLKSGASLSRGFLEHALQTSDAPPRRVSSSTGGGPESVPAPPPPLPVEAPANPESPPMLTTDGLSASVAFFRAGTYPQDLAELAAAVAAADACHAPYIAIVEGESHS